MEWAKAASKACGVSIILLKTMISLRSKTIRFSEIKKSVRDFQEAWSIRTRGVVNRQCASKSLSDRFGGWGNDKYPGVATFWRAFADGLGQSWGVTACTEFEGSPEAKDNFREGDDVRGQPGGS